MVKNSKLNILRRQKPAKKTFAAAAQKDDDIDLDCQVVRYENG
jgi:hypothetical protein